MGSPSRKTRREFLSLAGVAAVGGVLAACGSPAPTPSPTTAPAASGTPAASQPTPAAKQAASSGAEVQLRYVTRGQPSSPNFTQNWDEFKSEFNSRFPKIKVDIQPAPPNYQEQVVNSIVAGTAADVMEQCCWLSTYFVQEGHCLNLTPLIKAESDAINMNDFYKYQFDAWKDKKGDIFMMPTYTGTQVLYYNKDMFEAKGIPPLPKSWDDAIDLTKYAEIGNKLKESGQVRKWGSMNYGMGAKGNSWVTQYHLRGYGTNMVDPKDNTKSNLDDPKALECIENIRKWIWEQNWFAYGLDAAATGGLDLQNMFNAQKIGMMEIGSWGLAVAADGARFKWDVAPIPKGPAGLTTHQSVDGAMVWNKSKQPDESWILIRETAAGWNQRRKMKWGSQPSRKSVLADYPAELRKQNPVFKDVNLEIFAESFAKDIGRPEEMFLRDKVSKDEILGPAFDYVTLLNKGPVDIIGKAAKIVNKFNRDEIGVGDIGRELNAIGVS